MEWMEGHQRVFFVFLLFLFLSHDLPRIEWNVEWMAGPMTAMWTWLNMSDRWLWAVDSIIKMHPHPAIFKICVRTCLSMHRHVPVCKSEDNQGFKAHLSTPTLFTTVPLLFVAVHARLAAQVSGILLPLLPILL